MKITIANIGGQWMGRVDGLDEWLPLPFTSLATQDDVETYYRSSGYTVNVVGPRHVGQG